MKISIIVFGNYPWAVSASKARIIKGYIIITSLSLLIGPIGFEAFQSYPHTIQDFFRHLLNIQDTSRHLLNIQDTSRKSSDLLIPISSQGTFSTSRILPAPSQHPGYFQAPSQHPGYFQHLLNIQDTSRTTSDPLVLTLSQSIFPISRTVSETSYSFGSYFILQYPYDIQDISNSEYSK
ncbi:hypothetical protein BU17DRAFT_65421 [Hysterangium stoloniferum]|nr:hypothetical protein BU17DRAFT_65421 [Hysterangium stoloniferum]